MKKMFFSRFPSGPILKTFLISCTLYFIELRPNLRRVKAFLQKNLNVAFLHKNFRK